MTAKNVLLRPQGLRPGRMLSLAPPPATPLLQMWTSALFGVKNIVFSKFMACPYGHGGWACVDKEWGGQFFAILCGRPSWTAYNTYG